LKALNLGVIQYLLRLLNHESDEILLHRLLYTLSTLLRNFPQAQHHFLEHGGAELMIKLLDASQKIAIRTLTLINDLIIEKVNQTKSFLSFEQLFFSLGSSAG